MNQDDNLTIMKATDELAVARSKASFLSAVFNQPIDLGLDDLSGLCFILESICGDIASAEATLNEAMNAAREE